MCCLMTLCEAVALTPPGLIMNGCQLSTVRLKETCLRRYFRGRPAAHASRRMRAVNVRRIKQGKSIIPPSLCVLLFQPLNSTQTLVITLRWKSWLWKRTFVAVCQVVDELLRQQGQRLVYMPFFQIVLMMLLKEQSLNEAWSSEKMSHPNLALL